MLDIKSRIELSCVSQNTAKKEKYLCMAKISVYCVGSCN